MRNPLHILLIIFSIGLIFKPNETLACGTKKTIKEKTCELPSDCKYQEKTEMNYGKITDTACCDKLTSSEPNSNHHHHNCDGHCNHNSCSCASMSFSVNLPQAVDLKINSFISFSKITIISHDENQLPSGFHSIWLPPVIS